MGYAVFDAGFGVADAVRTTAEDKGIEVGDCIR